MIHLLIYSFIRIQFRLWNLVFFSSVSVFYVCIIYYVLLLA